MSNEPEAIKAFLSGERFAVAGASQDRNKYGNKVLRAYMQNNLEVHPINPTAAEVEGLRAYPDLAALVEAGVEVHGLSIVTPPKVTGQFVDEAAKAGIKHLWMQPGAESDEAIEEARKMGINVIAGGPCLLVALGYRE